MKKTLLFILLFCSSLYVSAQPAEYKMSGEEYIDKYKEEAVKEMLMSGVPASITLSQAMLESGNGNSPLAVYANNHFGIKCHKGWNGLTFTLDDDEKNECFRKYSHVLESYSDHSQFLRSRKWYLPLFELKTTDYKGWAYGLKKAGYATHPRYAEMLIDLIEQYKLYELDKIDQLPSLSTTSRPEKKASKLVQIIDREVLVENNIKYVVAKKGDSYEKICKDFDMRWWQIKKYNDLNENEVLKQNHVVYLQPKRNKSKEKTHTVKKGETLHQISQLYGVKLKRLYKYNALNENSVLKPADTVWLQRKR